MAGQSASHILNQSFLPLLAEEYRDEVQARIQQLLVSKRQVPDSAPLSVTFTHQPETSASLSLAYLPQADDSAAIVVHLIDTSEQKALEEKYAHSQKMHAVGQLAGGIAHDFNNLLTAMIGFCDLLLMRHPAGDPSFADIMQIKQNANRAANLVRQLLAFSRRQTLQPKELNITDVLAELSNLIRRLIGEHIELNIQHGRDLWPMMADHGQLEQVVINLAVNARDAMANGGQLTIRTSNVSLRYTNDIPRSFIKPSGDEPIARGDYILLEVMDTGTGIPRHIMDNIFEPFFSTKEVGHGTGLGLSTVYGIIRQTGGHIFVESEEGKGTRFALYFRRVEKDPSAADTPAAEQEDAHTHTNLADLTGKSTILLVEDEGPVRIFSARALRNKGYTVLEADSAEPALTLMQQQGGDIDLVISDVIMPGMDGPSMVKKIWESYPEMKVIFISGYAEDALVKMEGSEKHYHFLGKPFTLKQLAQKVKEVTG